ncbi:type II toxin-antitoxin system Phd/YefM family antitoxin, partial [Mycolicibacterium novocastrense]
MTTLPLAEVRANLSKLVDEAVRTHRRIEVTRQGRRAAVILSADDYDSIMETLAILSDTDLMRNVRAAEEDDEIFTLEEVTEEMRAAGRLPALTYRIEMTRAAKRALTEELPESVAVACWEFIRGPLADNPHRVGKPLRDQLEGRYSSGAANFGSST